MMRELFDMMPVFIMDNRPNCHTGNFECASQGCLTESDGMHITDCGNSFIVQFCSAILVSARAIFWHHAASFLMTVFVVVGNGTKKEVCRVYAGRIVAGMENTLSAWVYSCLNVVCNTVGQPRSISGPHLAVPGWGLGTNPWPTFMVAFLCDVLPEVMERYRRGFHQRFILVHG